MTEALQQEIRTLRSIFESERDPEGRVFAPLADAYRRAGELQHAVRLLNEGLARHPGFVPGHVVAAQLYVEQGLVEEAGIAARHALDLDSENVHALRSLLKVLEQNGDDESSGVRDRLVALDPTFDPDRGATVAEPPPLPESAAEPASDLHDTAHETSAPFAIEGDEPSRDAGVETFGEMTPTVDSEAVSAAEAEDTLMEHDLDVDVSGLDLAPAGPDLASDEPLVDLDELSPVMSEVEEVEDDALPDLALEPNVELPSEEPVLDLEDLAPVESTAEPDDTTVEAEPVEDIPGLSGEGYEEPVMDLADLGPSEGDDARVGLEDLAPEERVMELSELAPEPEAEEPVMELGDLAPDEDSVTDLADLAPPRDEPVMDLADLAPDESDEEEAVAVADLAPADSEEGEAVMELSDLAPEESEPVTELADLAPDEESDEESDEAGASEEVTMVGLVAQTADTEDTEDASASSTADDAEDDDDHEPGEPVYTRTLAELYVKQGAIGQAIEVYRHLSALDPDDDDIRERIEELESGKGLEEHAETVLSEEAEEEVEALARELSETGDVGHDEADSPFNLHGDAEEEAAEEPSGPTIDDYFQGLLGWKPGQSS